MGSHLGIEHCYYTGKILKDSVESLVFVNTCSSRLEGQIHILGQAGGVLMITHDLDNGQYLFLRDASDFDRAVFGSSATEVPGRDSQLRRLAQSLITRFNFQLYKGFFMKASSEKYSFLYYPCVTDQTSGFWQTRIRTTLKFIS